MKNGSFFVNKIQDTNSNINLYIGKDESYNDYLEH